MIVKTMPYEIIKPLSCDWAVFGEMLRRLRDESFRIKNSAIQYFYEDDIKRREFKKNNGRFPKKGEFYGSSVSVYNYVRPDVKYSAMGNVTLINQLVKSVWIKYKDDVVKRNMSIPSYRPNNPIEINVQSFNSFDFGQACVNLLSRKGVEELKKKLSEVKKKKNKTGGDDNLKFTQEQLNGISTSVTFAFNPGKNNAKQVLNRIISGEYKLSSSKIIYNERKNKWMLAVAYKFEPKTIELDKNRVLGIDMGVVYPAYMAVNYDKYWRDSIDGGQIEQYRKTVEARRRRLQRQAAVCGNGRIGHGRKKRMQPLEKISDKVANFRNTVNHTYAKKIVQNAVKLGCGTIQMEELSGINEKETFLKRWTYFDLQKKIEYRAKEYGIDVIKINPKYTSQRCSECGYIDERNRPKVPDQSKFKCLSCGYETNADFNAARNIATPYIDKIISLNS
ncbi:RNA-guided endonuclease TnpB family protein [Alicyclobacillus acidoterrestris]|uniref:RNA-guided endonuclease TnpB family protein n=1 Tax=Alicyclobacillus acidoterrestris (strain ATCC 49025 / DSM 3922 / CIP 106132 / NCIMB 13137 / GD3B) TaxID=1356854 RepID=T0DDI8_ALIAG|nr:RNA-guided endonuclease TnpB family protein [Alicyclobacillus acidoterrestris]EPZ47726.1 hypothetical protein N007_05585 [Alicyclobacillus acidoterrestris ATCC 49025]UNO47965.1 RNA-guided endonuclease TnpB family protein [Alicyclobacillus acidoterrestris]